MVRTGEPARSPELASSPSSGLKYTAGSSSAPYAPPPCKFTPTSCSRRSNDASAARIAAISASQRASAGSTRRLRDQSQRLSTPGRTK